MKPRAVAIVPVRVDSQRLPGKALLRESGKALFLHTVDAARRASSFERVLVATDSDAVEREARAARAEVIRTSTAPRTGSERCAEAARELDAELVVDIQGDWPEVDPADLDALCAELQDGARECATLAAPLADAGRIADPNVVKVVRGRSGDALYFSRAPIPFVKSAGTGFATLRHIGVYAFTKKTLLRVPELPSSGLDECEGLEQLRFLENGIAMRVLLARGNAWGIETRPDYDAFLARLGKGGSK